MAQKQIVPPVTEKINELCTVTYNNKTYTISITNLAQGVLSESFILPENTSGTVYSFTGEGCDIIRDTLSVHTDKSYLKDNALPKRIYNIFRELQNTEEPQYIGEEQDSKDSIFSMGNCRVTADKTVGFIKKIESSDGKLILKKKKNDN